MQNLRDKLMKAGLVSEEQAKKVAEAPARPPSSSFRPPPSSSSFRPPPSSSSRPRGPEGRPPRTTQGTGPLITARPQPLQAGGHHEELPLGSPIPKLPPLPGSKAHHQLESKKQAEHDRQLRELVRVNEVAAEPGDTIFYFVTRKQKLRRLEISKAQAEQLEKGELAVVERPEPAQIEHSLVPPAVAEQAQTLSAKAVRFFNRPGQPVGFLSDEDIRGRQDREAAEIEEPAAPEGGAAARADVAPNPDASATS